MTAHCPGSGLGLNLELAWAAPSWGPSVFLVRTPPSYSHTCWLLSSLPIMKKNNTPPALLPGKLPIRSSEGSELLFPNPCLKGVLTAVAGRLPSPTAARPRTLRRPAFRAFPVRGLTRSPRFPAAAETESEPHRVPTVTVSPQPSVRTFCVCESFLLKR